MRVKNLRLALIHLASIRPPGLAILLAAAFSALFAGAAFAQAAPQATLTPPPSADRVRSGMYDASDPPALLRFMEKIGYRVELGASP
jgi:hypothetical protein